MVNRCVAGGCSNEARHSSVWGEAVALHKFPSKAVDPKRHLAWVNFVRQKREAGWIPSAYSTLCSKHFVDSSFSNKHQYLIAAAENIKFA